MIYKTAKIGLFEIILRNNFKISKPLKIVILFSFLTTRRLEYILKKNILRNEFHRVQGKPYISQFIILDFNRYFQTLKIIS